MATNEQPPPTDKEWKLLLFIREHKFGTMTVDYQNGEPTVIRRPIATIKL